MANRRNQVFISYSHADVTWLKRLQVHLKPMERYGAITRWDDTLIKPGTDWREEIRAALARARVAVLLVSADFLASDFINTDELPPLLAAAERRGTLILPVIVSPSRFEQTPSLSRFQAVNPPSQPLNRMRRGRQEEVFVRLSGTIEEALRTAEQGSNTEGFGEGMDRGDGAPKGTRSRQKAGGRSSQRRRLATPEVSIRGYVVRELDSGSIEVLDGGVSVVPAKPVLRTLAVDLGVSLLNANGNPLNTRQLGSQIIRRATQPGAAAPESRRGRTRGADEREVVSAQGTPRAAPGSPTAREVSIRGYSVRELQTGSIEVLEHGVPIVPAKPVLRKLAKELGVSLLNANGNPRTTRQLGREIIRRARQRTAAPPE